ncbi:hypothetical protein BD410DRAFT_794663 [Rickenella mellea]|uniref:DUF7918 domain-containing protein n=1 Tax=Rickenella mellea TaxID=50990 RepID=A0A4Y7PQF3_9AGAM|nr:hypothetical protein BD410DRAFT_794663 [Rickenella mellea]
MRLHDYVAEVSCEGVVLEEYGTTVADDGKLVSCWIESEAGKEFAITWKFDVEDSSLGIIGKTCVDGSVIGQGPRIGGTWNTKQYGGVNVDDTTYRPFQFAPITLTDDSGLVAQRDLDSLGTIAVVMFQATKAGGRCSCKRNKRQVKLHEGPVHEKEKKLGGHCVQLGDVMKRDQPLEPRNDGHSHWKIVDGDTPLVTFRFMYRSKEFLQAQGIIPYKPEDNENANAGSSSQSSVTELVDQVVNIPIKDESEAEDEDALQRQLEEVQKKLQRIKRKRHPNESTKVKVKTEKRIKSEANARHRANVGDFRDVIDLTSD